MRRAPLIAVALLFVACAKAEQKADTATPAPPPAPPPPAPLALSDLAGTWSAKTMPMDRDTVLTTAELTMTSTKDGWMMSLPNRAKPKVTVALLEADSVVTTAGPFPSAVRKGVTATIRSVMRMKDGKLVGNVYAKYSNGDSATFRSEATRKTTP